MKVDRTSQLSRIAQSPPATDLSGGKASEALSTVRRNNFAAEDAVFFHSDLSLDATTPTGTGPETTGLPVSSVRGGDLKLHGSRTLRLAILQDGRGGCSPSDV